LLQLVDRHIDFLSERLKHSYSETGRHSIYPDLLLTDHLYGIRSERRLVKELCIHLAWRDVLLLFKESSEPATQNADRDIAQRK